MPMLQVAAPCAPSQGDDVVDHDGRGIVHPHVECITCSLLGFGVRTCSPHDRVPLTDGHGEWF